MPSTPPPAGVAPCARHRRPVLAAALFLGGTSLALVLAATLPRAAAAGGGALCRWRFERADGYVYKLAGPEATEVQLGGLLERTIYPADLAGGRDLACPAGRFEDLIFLYAFRLPKDAVDSGQSWPVRDLHDELPPWKGPVLAEGEGRCLARKGSTVVIRWTLRLSRSGDARTNAGFDRGTLAVTSVYHVKRGAIASAEFALEWSERVRDAPPKPFVRRGTLELVRTLDLEPRHLRERVDAAVGRGIDSLRAFLQRGEHRRMGSQQLGYLSIALLALEKGGVPQADPLLKTCFEEMDRYPPLAERPGVAAETYSVALAILALEGRSVLRAPETHGSTRIRYEKGETEKADRDRLEKLVRWLLDAREPGRGAWTYKRFRDYPEDKAWTDASNSQFAVLALHAASRAGVQVQAEVFRDIAGTLLDLQERDGPKTPLSVECSRARWLAPAAEAGGTVPREPPPRPARGFPYGMRVSTAAGYCTSSMTAAGVSSLLICRHELLRADALPPDLAASIEAAVRDGLAWQQRRHTMRVNWPDYQGWPLYHLYSLEKAYEIGEVERIGGHDWWAEGATEILAREKPPAKGAAAGVGQGPWGSADQTALALLFLTRASAEPEIVFRKGGREASGGRPVSPDDEDAVVLEGLGTVGAREVIAAAEVRDPEKRRGRIALAERAFAALAEDRRPVLAPALGKLLESSQPDCVRLAQKLLAEAAGEKVPDRAAADAFHARWRAAVKLAATDDPAAIPALRAALADAYPAVRRAAALGIARLNAVEAVPDLLVELKGGTREHRAFIYHVLVGLLGTDPGFDESSRASSVERFEKIWRQTGPQLVVREEVKRAIRALARPEECEAARARLRAAGEAAIRPLVDALDREEVRAEAAALLEAITGERFGEDKAAWLRWLETRGGPPSPGR